MELSTTVSMYLGIAFVLIAVGASVLQAWLWSFPMVPDPGGPDPNGKSTAPKHWTLTHRVLGGLYILIYVVLMIEMVPRLWEYQFELPARTVIHACMGIVIGILLVTKIGVIRWWQHFGKSLPALGLGLVASTIILGTLSIPFALRAHDFGNATSPETLAHVKKELAAIEWKQQGVDVAALATVKTMDLGRTVLTKKCVVCHDIKTILQKPRSTTSWYKVVQNMTEKPMLGEPIFEYEIPAVTAYLVALNKDIAIAFRRKRRVKAKQDAVAANVVGTQGAAADGDVAKGKALWQEHCTGCHDTGDGDSELANHGGDDAEGWANVVSSMVSDQDVEVDAAQAQLIVHYLANTHPKE